MFRFRDGIRRWEGNSNLLCIEKCEKSFPTSSWSSDVFFSPSSIIYRLSMIFMRTIHIMSISDDETYIYRRGGSIFYNFLFHDKVFSTFELRTRVSEDDAIGVSYLMKNWRNFKVMRYEIATHSHSPPSCDMRDPMSLINQSNGEIVQIISINLSSRRSFVSSWVKWNFHFYFLSLFIYCQRLWALAVKEQDWESKSK